MFNKISSILLLCVFIALCFQPAFAQKGSWEAVKNVVNQDIAVQKTNSETVFASLNSANDNEIVIKTATKEDFSNLTTTINKNEVKKVWLATLRFNERNTAKGALIGAGVGVAIGVAVVVSQTKKGDTDGLEALGIPIIMLPAAGVGALFGYLTKKGHKKGKLIYSL